MDKSEAQAHSCKPETMGKATVCMFVLFLATTASVFGWGVQDRRSFLQTVPLQGLAIFAPESTTNGIRSSKDCDNGIGDVCVEDKDSDDEEDSDSEDDSDSDGSDEDVDSDSSDNDSE